MEGKKCRLNIWHRAQKMNLQEISLWGNLGLLGRMVWEAAGVCEGHPLSLCSILNQKHPDLWYLQIK